MPGRIKVIAGFASFSIPLWWEDSVWFSALQVAIVLKPQRGVASVSKASIVQEEVGTASRGLVCVEEGLCGKGILATNVDDRDLGLEPRKPEVNSR